MSLKQFLRSVVSSVRTDRRRKTAFAVHRMEQLEQRALLAGNVLVTLQNGNATITGDTADNSVELVVSGSTLIVRGVDGTTINGATTAFTLSSTSTTFSGSLVAMLGAGDDAFSIGSGVTLSSTVKVSGEAGDDTLGVSGTVTGRLTLSAGAGSDAIAVRNATAPGGISIDASGSVVVAISDSTIGSSLVISTGNGDDDIVISDTTINGSTSITTRSGNDDVVLKDSTLRGAFYLSADRGDDVAVIDSTTIDGKAELWMRQGNDSVQVQGNSVLSSRFFVGQRLGRNSTEIQSTATVSRLRQVGRPSGDVSDSLIETRITNATTGAIAKADAVNAIVAPTLSVVIAANSIVENAGAAATTATITRTGSTATALTVNLSSSNDSRARFAATTATIPAGQSSVTVDISAVDNTTADVDSTVTLTAAATGFVSGTDTVVVTGEEVAALTVTAAQSTFAENAAEAARTFTVSRNTTDTSGALTVNLASNTTGRLTVPATVTIPANASSITFVATTNNNTTVDPSAQVIVTATVNGFTNGTSTVTVTDDDSPSLTLSASPSTILENAGPGAVTFTVTRNAVATTADLVVLLSSGSTRLTVPANVTIPAGQSIATFTATPTNNDLFSGQSTVTVTATANGLTNGIGSVIINDDESAALALTPSVTTVSEAAPSPAVTYTISRNTSDTTSAITVALTSSDTNRLTVPANVTIQAGQSSATFVGTPASNTTVDGSKLVTVTATLTGFTTAQTAVTVTDDDGANLSITGASSITENAGDNTLQFTVSRNAADTTSALTVNLSSNLTSRFTIPGTVTIAAGQTTATVAGTPVNNNIDDGNATVTISATASGLTSTSTTVSVTDDDDAALTITADPVSVAENAAANANTITFTVSRNSADISSELVVNLSDASSARFDIPATVTIPANARTTTFQGSPVSNTTDDGNATVKVTASRSGFASDDVDITVTDDDAATLTLTASPTTSVSEGAGANAFEFTLTRNSGDLTQALTVNLSSADTSRLTVPANVSIPVGQSSVKFFGAAVDDTVVNSTLTVLVTASQTNFTNGTSTVTLTDNDVPTLTLAATPTTAVAESAGANAFEFTLSRNSGNISQDLIVTLASSVTSRLTVPQTATIPAGQTQVKFFGTAIDDTVINSSLTVVVTATRENFATGTTTVTLNDNDAGTLSLTAASQTLNENSSTPVQFTLKRTTADYSQPITVQLAAPGGRFSVPAIATIPAGFDRTTFSGTPTNNATVDTTTTVVVSANAAGYGAGQSTITVRDDDAAALSLSLSASSVAETAGTNARVLTVTRVNVPTTSALTVNLTRSATSRISMPTSVEIPAGQSSATVNISTVDNDAVDGSESVTITGTAGTLSQQAVLTVTDNENAVLSLTLPQTTVAENAGTLVGTVASSITSSADIIVNLAYSDPAKLTGPATVTIPAGQLTANVTFTIAATGILDGSGTARIVASATGASPDAETVTINDVDDLPISASTSSNTVVQSNGTVITRNPTFTITGVTEPNASISVDSNGDGTFGDQTATANASGNYTFTVTLTHTATNFGANRIAIRSTVGPETGDTAVDVHLSVGKVIRFETSEGDYDVELLGTDAPVTVANFLSYMNSTKYDNLIVHRSPPDFVIQAGGFTVNNGEVASVVTNAPIANEFKAANSNLRGTLSMAQLGSQPASGTSQWFINVVDNAALDDAKHTVFGRVVGTGMTVVEAINNITIRDINTLYGQSALNQVPLQNAPPAGTQITGTVSTTTGSKIVTGAGTSFTSQLAVGNSVKIGSTLFFVESIQSDTSLTLKSNVQFSASLLTVMRDVVPDDTDFVVFSDISQILDAI